MLDTWHLQDTQTFLIFSDTLSFFFFNFIYVFRSPLEILHWFFAVQDPVKSFVIFVEDFCSVVQADLSLMIPLRIRVPGFWPRL